MANDFSTDTSVKALWDFESGALVTDSSGKGNTLTNNNGVTADTVNYWQGAASALLSHATDRYFNIPDASLCSGFPLKYGDSVQKATFCFWLRPTTIGTNYPIFAKGWNTGSPANSFGFFMNGGSAPFFGWLTSGGLQWFNLPSNFTVNHVYHCSVFVDGINKILNIFIWDYTAGSLFCFTKFTPTSQLILSTGDFDIGGDPSDGAIDGNVDEFVVFNRLLNLQEVENIRNRTYTGPYTPASPGNIFTGDSRFQAVWDFESGALTTDSSPAAGGNGANTLTASGSSLPTADPFGVEEGADAAYLGGSNAFQIADGSLSANFPLQNGDSVKKITVCGWVIPAAWGGSYNPYIWWKNNGSNVGAGAAINSSGHLIIVVGNQSFGTVYDTGIVLNLYGIYHIACVMDGVNGTLNVRVYNAATQTASDYSTSIATITVGVGNFTLGINQASGIYFQGWLDEFVVANALLSDAEIDKIREEIFGAPITRNLSTTASVVSSTSSVMLGVTRKLATSPAVSTSTGSPLLNILRKLTCSPAAGSSTSAVMLAVLRKLACSPAVVSSVSTPNLAVQRNLATLAVVLSETSDTVYLDLNAVRQLSTIAAVVSSTSAANLAILRKLVSECAVITSTPEVMLAVLRKLATDIPVLSTTSAAVLGYLLRLATAADVTTETPAVILKVLRRLLTEVAVQTETSAAQLTITGVSVPLPPPVAKQLLTLSVLLNEAHKLPQSPTLAELLNEAHKVVVWGE